MIPTFTAGEKTFAKTRRFDASTRMRSERENIHRLRQDTCTPQDSPHGNGGFKCPLLFGVTRGGDHYLFLWDAQPNHFVRRHLCIARRYGVTRVNLNHREDLS